MDPLHTRQGLQSRLSSVAHWSIDSSGGRRDLDDEPGLALSHDQSLDQPGADQTFAGAWIGNGLQNFKRLRARGVIAMSHGSCHLGAAVISATTATVTPARSHAIARKTILIAGATATGKSALAMRLAEDVGGVVVNADSQQLYQGLCILSARPTPEDEARLPHRLYGVVDPSEAWSVGRWLDAVQTLLAEEDRPLVIVGGTGLYFHALLRGLAPIPPVDPAERDTVEADFVALGEAAFRRRLSKQDPEAEARIMPGDRQRLVRALTVAQATGRPLSAWQAETSKPLLRPEDCERWVVERDRQDLYARCDARVDAMMAQGVLDEVEQLLARNLAPDRPAMLAVGVRELAALIRGEATPAQAVDVMKLNTRHYAKRQLTWFRNQTPDWPRHQI